MVNARVSDEYIHFSIMYTTGNIFTVIPIKHLVNQVGEPTTPHKLETGMKTSVSNLHVLVCPCAVQKATAHVDTKALNMHNNSQKVFGLSSLEFHNIKRVPNLRTYYTKIVSSYDVVSDETFSSALAYTLLPCSESITTQPVVS